MTLYLVRHAHALDETEDSTRPLSKKGRRQIVALAALLKAVGAVASNEIWHSPLARSRESAVLLNERLKLGAKLVEVSGIEGDNDPQAIARRLDSRRQPLVIVGHEPHLSGLASLLLSGSAEPRRVVLKKSAALALDRDESNWKVRWLISPEVVL